MSASNFLLDDRVYSDVRAGWNHKLTASSQQLSGLVPFVELYAVFKSKDVIFHTREWGGPAFSDIADRAINVEFQYSTGGPAGKLGVLDLEERFDIKGDSIIVPIASSAKSQTESDSIVGPSYKGHAGINDLAVSRGASGPMNVKFDLNITLPNPELINEMYEYSKLMILNSAFLLTYGWNPHGFDYDTGPTAPPKVVPGVSAQFNPIELNSSNGGFYKSTLVKLYRFNFSLDNVGHLGGKMSFLTLAGNFLVSTKTEAISTYAKKLLNGYSGMLFSSPGDSLASDASDARELADMRIADGEDYLDVSKVYFNWWEKSIQRRTTAFNLDNPIDEGPRRAESDQFGDRPDQWRPGENRVRVTEEEKINKEYLAGIIKKDGVNVPEGYEDKKADGTYNPLDYEIEDWPASGGYSRPGDRGFPTFGKHAWAPVRPQPPKPPVIDHLAPVATYLPVLNDGQDGRGTEYIKTVPFAEWMIEKGKKMKTEVLGFMDIENGLPWAMPKMLEQSGALEGAIWDADPLTTLDTMPAYGKDLMTMIWTDYMKIGNPNRPIFYPVFPEDPNGPVQLGDLGRRWVEPRSDDEIARASQDPYNPDRLRMLDDFLDPETVKIMKNSCTISTMLLEVAPDEELSEEADTQYINDAVQASGELIGQLLSFVSGGAIGEEATMGLIADVTGTTTASEDQQRAIAEGQDQGSFSLNEGVVDALGKLGVWEVESAGVDQLDPADDETLRFTTLAKPVYYFLGAVLESLSIAMNEKIKFVFSDIPLEGEISPGGFSLPLPQASKERVDKIRADIEKIDKDIQEWKDLREELDAMPNGKDGGDEEEQRRFDAKKRKRPVNPTEDELDDESRNKFGVIILFPGEPMSNEIIGKNTVAREGQAAKLKVQANIELAATQEILAPIQCKNVFELPVDISKVRAILEESNAPLHNMINKILKACDKTTRTIRLSTRPYAADETYLEIFVANIQVAGVTKEVFNDLDIHAFLTSSDVRANITQDQLKIAQGLGGADYSASDVAAARTQALGSYFSEKAVVCEFGSERSLVESFSLSSKVDPNAFATFRLPEIIGGQSIDIAAIVRGSLSNSSMGFMNDMKGILEKGMYSGKQQLRDLQIISGTGDEVKINERNLKSFLMAETPAATKIQSTFLSNLMAVNQDFNTKVMSIQNEGITGSGGRQNTPENNAFYGGVLSSYLRTISLTIHGTVGLGMFNVVYIKGLMRGIEGLYLITSVNESVTPGSFSTSLECKLIQYKDTSQNNPLAANLNITLEKAAEAIKKGDSTGASYTNLSKATYEHLFDQTEKAIEDEKNKGILME